MGANSSIELMAKHFDKLDNDYAYARNSDAKSVVYDKLFVLIDTDKSGTIDNKELIALASSLQKAFKKSTKKKIENETITAIIKEYDLNQDGGIDRREFYKLMEKIEEKLFVALDG